jgi:hypothetical protein
MTERRFELYRNSEPIIATETRDQMMAVLAKLSKLDSTFEVREVVKTVKVVPALEFRNG